jgi:glycosyltransferase involved in cell wall biosynthesis
MAAPAITVITPVLNGMPYLKDAIASVIAQQYAPLEMIVVDDGSRDGSGAMARGVDICRVLRTPGIGPAAARNVGIKASTSDLLVFLDADDMLGPSLIRSSVEALRRTPDAGFAQGCIQNFTTKPDGTMNLFTSAYRFINLGSGVWRRSVFEAVGLFDECLRLCEDLDFVMRCWERDIQKIPVECLLFYRRHAGNMTSGLKGADCGTLHAYRKRIERIRNGDYDPNRPRRVSWPDYLGMPPQSMDLE